MLHFGHTRLYAAATLQRGTHHVSVDQERQQTARERRRAVIGALDAQLNRHDLLSAASALESRIVGADDQSVMVVNLDIDGLVSAMMLASVTGWRAIAAVDRSQRLLLAPGIDDGEALMAYGNRLFGVDVFSTRFANVSNHPVLTGSNVAAAKEFDAHVVAAGSLHSIANPSLWCGIGASLKGNRPNGMPYKYPLGTAQVLLALLESIGSGPKFYDRQYLPWIVAHCDGGLDSIRTYPWNVELWWSSLAAAVGPASVSEWIYRLASQQRPTEQIDIDRRLRYEEPERSMALTSKWNLAASTPGAIATVVGLLSDLSGWPDPFVGGVESLGDWTVVEPTRGSLPMSGLTTIDPTVLVAHLDAARRAVHFAGSTYKERGVQLGWMLAEVDPLVAAATAATLPAG